MKSSKALAVFLALALAFVLMGIAQHQHQEKQTQKESDQEVYTCPMHPEVQSDKPGKCPKCGMNLEKKTMPMMEQHSGMMMGEHACCMLMGLVDSKDAEVTVENLKDGVSLRITSKDAAVVKKIQENAAQLKEDRDKKAHSHD
jgi:hypothetical protein